MLIDVVRPEAWDELNDRVQELLSLNSKERVRCYKGIGTAVYEIARGTAQFLTHKKSIAFVLGQTPVYESLLPAFYKETYEVVTLPHTDLIDAKAWVEGLKRETNFVLFSEDHPVTAERYPFVEELDELLNSKRIYSFRVSHHQHFYEQISLKPYTVRICSFASDVSVAFCGERFRSPPLVVREESWDGDAFCHSLIESRRMKALSQDLILKFEKEVSVWAVPFFSDRRMRIWDRAVVVFSDVSAEAVAKTFSKSFGGQLWAQMETPNMCRWRTSGLFQKWWQPAISLDALRGMLIIDQGLLQNKDFAKQLHSAYEEVKKQQSWNV